LFEEFLQGKRNICLFPPLKNETLLKSLKIAPANMALHMNAYKTFTKKTRTEAYHVAKATVADMEGNLKERMANQTDSILTLLSKPEYDLPDAFGYASLDDAYYEALVPKSSSSSERSSAAVTRKPAALITTVQASSSTKGLDHTTKKTFLPDQRASNQAFQPKKVSPAESKRRESPETKEANETDPARNTQDAASGAEENSEEATELSANEGASTKEGVRDLARSGSVLGPLVMSEKEDMPAGVINEEHNSLLEKGVKHYGNDFYHGLTIYSHPWAFRAIQHLVPIAFTYARELGLARICLAAKFEAHTPPDSHTWARQFSTYGGYGVC
jgi:hypothetical protein